MNYYGYETRNEKWDELERLGYPRSKVGMRQRWFDNRSCQLRSDATGAEISMRRTLNLMHISFAEQSVVNDKYIVDFIAFGDPGDIVIEIDGGYHNRPAQARADDERDQYMIQLGFSVIRVANESALNFPKQIIKNITRSWFPFREFYSTKYINIAGTGEFGEDVCDPWFHKLYAEDDGCACNDHPTEKCWCGRGSLSKSKQKKQRKEAATRLGSGWMPIQRY